MVQNRLQRLGLCVFVVMPRKWYSWRNMQRAVVKVFVQLHGGTCGFYFFLSFTFFSEIQRTFSWITPKFMKRWFIWTLSNWLYRTTGTILLSTLHSPLGILFIKRILVVASHCYHCAWTFSFGIQLSGFKEGDYFHASPEVFYTALPNWPWLQRLPAPS